MQTTNIPPLSQQNNNTRNYNDTRQNKLITSSEYNLYLLIGFSEQFLFYKQTEIVTKAAATLPRPPS